MASSEPQFQLTVDYSLSPNKFAPLFYHTQFLLQIRTFLEDYNGRLQEDHSQGDFEELSVLPGFVLGSDLHRRFVAYCLVEAGWVDQGRLESVLAIAFSVADSMLESEKEKNGKSGDIVTIIFRVKKIIRTEYDDHELEARASMELSMQEEPKLVPATEEPIQALTKVKLEDDGKGIECMICMEKLVRSKTEVVTSMPCSHLFHADCIEKWLNTGHLCPLCRFPMPIE